MMQTYNINLVFQDFSSSFPSRIRGHNNSNIWSQVEITLTMNPSNSTHLCFIHCTTTTTTPRERKSNSIFGWLGQHFDSQHEQYCPQQAPKWPAWLKRYSGVSWQQDALKIRALFVMYDSNPIEISEGGGEGELNKCVRGVGEDKANVHWQQRITQYLKRWQ